MSETRGRIWECHINTKERLLQKHLRVSTSEYLMVIVGNPTQEMPSIVLGHRCTILF